MRVHRRTLLRGAAALGLGGALAGCTKTTDGFIKPGDPEIQVAESRRSPGPVREFTLTAAAAQVDLGGPVVSTWAYDGIVPGNLIRVKAGEVVHATLDNQLPRSTTVHWHGLALRNDADGVPDATQPPIASGAKQIYQFTAPDPGTYWFHPHVGVQLDRGLYAPLIVDDVGETLAYDQEWIVVLDDWLDGVTGTPDEVFNELRQGMSEGHTGGKHAMMGASSFLLGGDAGDVRYPHFLFNGRVPAAAQTLSAKPGQRVRIRFINAGSDTAFRVAIGGHRMTLTHSDGFPLQPIDTDALLIGMGERYDAIVTLGDGVFPVVALAEGKQAVAFGLIRTGGGEAPQPSMRPRELDGRIVEYRQMKPAANVRLPDRSPDRTVTLKMTGGMARYDWTFNNRQHDPAHREPVRAGERVRIEFINTTTMWHPVHLHGHTFALAEGGLRKDTAIVLPGQTLPVVFDADNPGVWMVHCHNAYHAESGMMTLLGYHR